jgi:Zn-dependent peptidase ImmA (M78 family)
MQTMTNNTSKNLDFSLTNESDAPIEPEAVNQANDFATEGLLETIDTLTEMFTQSQQVYGTAIETLEKRLYQLEVEFSKLVLLMKLKNVFGDNVTPTKPEPEATVE